MSVELRASLDRLTRATCTFAQHIDRDGVGWSRMRHDDVCAVLGRLEALETLNNVLSEKLERRTLLLEAIQSRATGSLSVSQDEQTASLLSRIKEAEGELASLREWRWSFDPLTLTHAMVVGLLAEVNDNDAGRDLAETLEAVRDNLTVAARDLQAAKAQIKVLEGALETFAILANEETDYLPDEHLISLTYDDSDLDDDLGGPNTLLGERFMRAFRRARAALLPQLGGENG